MRNTFLVYLLALMLFPATLAAQTEKADTVSAGKEKAKTESTEKKQSKPNTWEGFITITKEKKDDNVTWFFHVPDSLLKRDILVTYRYISTPSNRTDTYGGELAKEQVVYFELSPEGKLQLRSNILVSAADTLDAINRAVRMSNENPIISTFKVESHKDGMYKIKVNGLFLGNDAGLCCPADMRTTFGLSSLSGNDSYIESMKAFPMNAEIRTLQTWNSHTGRTPAAQETNKVTIRLNVSFVLLPKKPMMRRLFDPRVGYFADKFTSFSDYQQKTQDVRFVTRWRLEPKDSADAERMKRGELVEPKKQIVYYVDPATPKKWRKYLIMGINDWNKAFEQAGFKNAIEGREWPENDSTMSMEDARYSCIRYLASETENAYGPNVHDPRSGEILESHPCWYHNVMALLHDWYMIQAGNLDEAARTMKFDDELMGQLIRFVSSHEIGHTLGLRHNFGSSSTVPVDSLRSRDFVIKHGHTPSIMDYARFNYVAQPEDSIPHEGIFPRIGDYDCWAIQWGYTPTWKAYDEVSDHWEMEKLTTEKLRNNRRLWFGDGETARTRDARCQTEDLGDDAVKASTYGIMNLKRILPKLPEWTYQSGDIYGSNLTNMYYQVCTQYMRYMGHVLRNIAAQYADYKTVDEAGAVYTYAPREKQLAAFHFLEENVLEEPTWLLSPAYLNRILTDPEANIARIGQNMAGSMSTSLLLEKLNKNLPVSEYLPMLTRSVFREADSRQTPSAYRMKVQDAVLTNLIDVFTSNSGKAEVTAAAYAELKRLQSKFRAASSVAYYALKAHQLDKALAITPGNGQTAARTVTSATRLNME